MKTFITIMISFIVAITFQHTLDPINGQIGSLNNMSEEMKQNVTSNIQEDAPVSAVDDDIFAPAGIVVRNEEPNVSALRDDPFSPTPITITNEPDDGVLAVAADVQQIELFESGIQLQNWDITFKVGAGDANTYTAAKNGQPTFVTLDDNFAYEVDPFLQIEFADQTTQSVPLKTINNQLITEGNTDPPFLTLSPFDCQGNIAEGQTSICTIKVIFTEEAIDLISDFIDIDIGIPGGWPGGWGGELSSANQHEGANIGVVGAELNKNLQYKKNLTSAFFNMIEEGKSTLLNVRNIDANSTINYDSLSCFLYVRNAFKGDIMDIVDCNKVIVFGKDDTVLGDEDLASRDAIISSPLTIAINDGLQKSIGACAIIQETFEKTLEKRLQSVPCKELFILYK